MIKAVQVSELPQKVELGCGRRKTPGFYGVDLVVDGTDADAAMDLNEMPWDLPDDYFTHVKAFHVIEHLDDPKQAVEEIHRICQDGATVEIAVPHFSGPGAYNDLTHTRSGVGSDFIKYFTEDSHYNFYSDARFDVEDITFGFEKRKILCWNYVVEPIVNQLPPQVYEKTFLHNLFPCREVMVTAEVVK